MNKEQEKLSHMAVQLQKYVILLRRMLKESNTDDLTPPQRSLLLTLIKSGPQRLSTLAKIEKVSAPAITRTVQQLEAKNLVLKKRGKDKRVTKVDYTTTAWALLDHHTQTSNQKLVDQLIKLSKEDLELLQQSFSVLQKITSPPS